MAQSKALNNVFKLKDVVNVKEPRFGAVGDGVTDDTAAIQAALTALAAGTFKSLYFPPAGDGNTGGYRTTDTITIGAISDCTIIMDGNIKYDGTQTKPALSIGAEDAQTARCKFDLKVYSENTPTWADSAYIGIRLYNVVSSEVNITRAQGFTKGAQLMGWGQGFAYNRGSLGYIVDNQVGVELISKRSSTLVDGYVNENLFLKGRIACSSTLNLSTSREGIRITSDDGNYVTNNKNTFIGPSLEIRTGTLSGGATATSVNVIHGISNKFLDLRQESSGTTAGGTSVLVQNASHSNVFESTYDAIVLVDSSTLPSSTVLNQSREIHRHLRTGWESGALSYRMANYDGSTSFTLRGIDVYRSGGAGVPAVGDTSLDIDNATYIASTGARAIGISIDTTYHKRFVVFRNLGTASRGGRVVLIPRDANGAILADASPDLILGTSGIALSVVTSYASNSYESSNEGDDPITFTVGSTVKQVDVLIRSGSNHFNLNAFSVYACDPNVSSAFRMFLRTDRDMEQLYGTAIPVRGRYKTGTRMVRYPNASGSPKAWVCTAGSQDVTGSITTGTPDLVISGAGNFAAGQGITVVGAGAAGANLYTTISVDGGTSLTLAGNAGTSVTDAVVFHSGTWASEGNL